jgi:hypothetical protein
VVFAIRFGNPVRVKIVNNDTYVRVRKLFEVLGIEIPGNAPAC